MNGNSIEPLVHFQSLCNYYTFTEVNFYYKIMVSNCAIIYTEANVQYKTLFIKFINHKEVEQYLI